MVKRHILFVDDDLQTLTTVSFMLEQAGYVVKKAEDGFAGIEFARRLAFDLVLLDISMPHMDGYTILETFKNIPEMKSIPIIMLTGRDDVKSVKKATEKGAMDYIIKPVKKDDLLSRVSNIVGTAPQYKEYHLNSAKDPAKGTLVQNFKVISVSETGMIFHTENPLKVGSTLTQFKSELFAELELQVPRLKIIECIDEKDHYEIYASFIEMPETDIPKIREWVIEKVLNA